MVAWCTSFWTSRSARAARARARPARYAEFSIVRGGCFLTLLSKARVDSKNALDAFEETPRVADDASLFASLFAFVFPSASSS